MEGGYHPWKQQAIAGSVQDVGSYGKPLPPPPRGHYWERQDNGEWILLQVYKYDEVDVSAVEFTKPSIIEHTVMPGDTLQGLCLRYRTSAINIRRLNMFSGNNIQYLKNLLIPIDGACVVNLQQNTHEVILQKFRNITSEGVAESRLYLEEHGWNLEAAVQDWRKDDTWEQAAAKDGALPTPPADIPSRPGDGVEDSEDEEEDSDEEEEIMLNGNMRRVVAPAAVEDAPITVPAYIASSSRVIDIEMATSVSSDQEVLQPLLA